MEDELFDELIDSMTEAGQIIRGERKPSRTFHIASPNVKQIRADFQLSQSEFATMLGISVKTLQNWEQGRRSPRGPARVLLQVAQRHPDVVRESVYALTASEGTV